MIALMYIGVIVISYVLGSIPFGLLISKKFARTDVREVGSGKIGMTNVLRTAGKKAAALSLILDIAKGAAAVLIAGLIFHNKTQAVASNVFTLNESAKVLAAMLAIIGHSWPVFLKFKGGRGVATFMGGLAALYWPAALIGGIFIFGIGFRTKYMSLGSIIGAVTAAILLLAFYVCKVHFLRPNIPFEYVVFALAGAIFVYVMHRDNILRLYNGTERKIGEKINVESTTPSHNPK
jgi:glycerol-3-phosphate acyltransferase PlsY